MLHTFIQHTFNTFVGGKLLGPTFLGSPTVRIVGVGVTFSLLLWKEYVSLLIGLYKNNGSVSCVGINFLLIRSLYLPRHGLVLSVCVVGNFALKM